MKEFEKWYKEYTARVEPQIDYLDTQLGWRAALEWIYYAGVLTDLPKDLINEELNNE